MMAGRAIGFVRVRWLLIAALLIGVVLAAWYSPLLREKLSRISGVKVPQVVLLEDFQRPLDRDLTAQLMLLENTKLMQAVEGKVLKPFVDDVNSIHLSKSAVEVTPGQFPDHPELAQVASDCARTLHVTPPKVYVVNGAEPIAFTTNFKEPVIILYSGLLRGSPPLSQLRFIIGREMGHVRSSHTKWMVVMRGLMEAVRSAKIAPDEVSLAPFLPVFKWAREAEMSADAAGLICCQDLTAAEQAVVRLAHGSTWADMGRVDVDGFLAQRENADFSKFAEVVQYWRELVRPQPFVPDRIRQLREYASSRQYQHLWE